MSLPTTASFALPKAKAPANAETADIVCEGHGYVYKKDLHPRHFINPANELAVRELHATAWEDNVTGFEYHTSLDNKALVFQAYFFDRASFPVCNRTPEEVLRSYPRANALVSLLKDQRFAGVEAFAVACENALGGDVDTVNLELCPNKFCRSPGEFNSVITRAE